MQQIGNAVPPMAAQVFAEHLKTLDGQFGSSTNSPRYQINPRFLGFVLTEASAMSGALQKTAALLNGILQPELELS